MEEKYYIINNADQFYVILKCTKNDLLDYDNYGQKSCITQEGSLDLVKISEWLINRKIKHTVIFGKINNPILKSFINRDLDVILSKAIENGLFIQNDEIDNLLSMSYDKKKEMFW